MTHNLITDSESSHIIGLRHCECVSADAVANEVKEPNETGTRQ